ncbi:MAG: ATP-dependent DNA ligase [Acidimicrobiales bacterium]
MLLNELVATSAQVAATSSRKTKTERLAELFRALEPEEAEIAVGLLVGEPRQGRIGIGWATVSGVEAKAAAQPSLTLIGVDSVIAKLEATSGPGSAGRRGEQLTAMFALATSDEVEFLQRLFVGEIRSGALGGLVADAIAKANRVPATVVRRAAMLSGNLGTTAVIAASAGRTGLEAVGLTVLTAVQPMLASTAADVGEALTATGAASVEWKLDGARVQVHRLGDEVRIFTRNLNDITSRLPSVVAAVRSLPLESVVLDGETLSFGHDRRPVAFQDTMSRLGQDRSDDANSLKPFFFDVLHVDGQDLIDLPLSDRLVELERIASPYRIPAISTDDPLVAATTLNAALDAGHEGVMIKSLDSPYQAGRRGKSWRKVKPVHTLDLVVLAAEWGHGRRTGWLSNLHLGARDGDSFVMVGKTFKGLTDDLLRWQTENFAVHKLREDDYTVYLEPHFVVEIAVDGAQSSTRYRGGVALRFARVRHYRPDKSIADVDSIETVRSLLH